MLTNMNIILKSVGIGYHVNRMKFHPYNDSLLAVYGNRECIIININIEQQKVIQTINLNLMLEQLGDDLFICDLCWVPTSQSHIAVMTKQFIKIYDVSKDTFSPVFCINQIENANGLNQMT